MGVTALPWQQAAASAVLPAQPRPPPPTSTTFPFLTPPRKRRPPTLMVVTEPTEGHRLAARPRLYRGRVLEQPHRTWAGTSSARPTSVTPPSDRMDTGRTRRGEEAEGAEEQWRQSQTVSLHRRSGSCHTHPPNHPLRAGLHSPLRHSPGQHPPLFVSPSSCEPASEYQPTSSRPSASCKRCRWRRVTAASSTSGLPRPPPPQRRHPPRSSRPSLPVGSLPPSP